MSKAQKAIRSKLLEQVVMEKNRKSSLSYLGMVTKKEFMLQGTPRCESPPKERIGIFGEGCEILE